MAERKLEVALARLGADVGLKPLNKLWAKLEIALGLLAAGAGLLLGCWGVTRPTEMDMAAVTGGLVLFVLGGYLALAGHRSHLYQSNNLLTAHLADLIRRANDKG